MRVLARHLIIDLLAAVLDRTNKQFFCSRPGETERDQALGELLADDVLDIFESCLISCQGCEPISIALLARTLVFQKMSAASFIAGVS